MKTKRERHKEDFGFSFLDESELEPNSDKANISNDDVKEIQDHVDILTEQYYVLNQKLDNLLQALSMHPEKKYFKWENRLDVVAQLEELLADTSHAIDHHANAIKYHSSNERED